MSYSHRNGDSRICGASTVVIGQNFVKINGQLWSVSGDPNSHGDGQLIASQNFVKINGIPVILQNDSAVSDDFLVPPHNNPFAVGFDATVSVN